jgi:ABC-type nitrate/sulfonate/bicarbonate transport system substrate-binding protein
MEQGWGELLFDGTDETIWNKYIGGKVPVTSHFTLQSTIDKDPAKMQAFVTALWRAAQWIKAHSPEQIYDTIEPYVGSTFARRTSWRSLLCRRLPIITARSMRRGLHVAKRSGSAR